MFRVTQPYSNFLVKPRIFFRFSGKNIILCILKGEMPYIMHLYFSRKKTIKKMCVPTMLKFSDPLQETHFFLFVPISRNEAKKCLVSGYVSDILGSEGRQTFFFFNKNFLYGKV